MMDLQPLVAMCPCGAPAVAAGSLQVVVLDLAFSLPFPVCLAHAVRSVGVAGLRYDPLPTHHPVEISVVDRYPGKGEIFSTPEGGLVVGCPQCGRTASLGPAFRLTNEKLEPSFVCPSCGFHAWLRRGVPAVWDPAQAGVGY